MTEQFTFTASEPAAQDGTIQIVVEVTAAPAVHDVIVDLGIFDAAGQKVHQQVSEHVDLAPSGSFTVSFIPPSSGEFELRGGIFTAGWGEMQFWQNDLRRFSGSPAAVTTAAPPAVSDQAPPTGGFQVSGTQILGPDGQPFVAVGANVGALGFMDMRGTAAGHSADAVAWGWNLIRLNVLATDIQGWSYAGQHGTAALWDAVGAIVTEYTAAGIVVMIEAHETPKEPGQAEPLCAGLEEFWAAMAQAHAANPRVWFNIINEPVELGQAWVDLHERFLRVIRERAQNIVVVDAPGWGQDIGGSAGPDGRFSYEDTMMPALMGRFQNIVLGHHNYGAGELYTTPERYGAYLDRLAAAGIPMISSEFGFTTDGTTSAGSFELNRLAANTVLEVNPGRGIGMLWWNATGDDNYSLKADGSCFYAGDSPGAGLSEPGQRFWDLGHRA